MNARIAQVEAPRKPSTRSVVYREETSIRAEPSRIWNVLIDLSRYSEWNPWLTRAEGEAEVGGAVEVDVMLGTKRMRAKHIVLAVEPHVRFCWRDAGWNALFVYAQRCRILEPREDGSVRFTQELLLDGPFARLADLMYGKALRQGLAAETAALKQRAES